MKSRPRAFRSKLDPAISDIGRVIDYVRALRGVGVGKPLFVGAKNRDRFLQFKIRCSSKSHDNTSSSKGLGF